jgi:hypothetical protein
MQEFRLGWVIKLAVFYFTYSFILTALFYKLLVNRGVLVVWYDLLIALECNV